MICQTYWVAVAGDRGPTPSKCEEGRKKPAGTHLSHSSVGCQHSTCLAGFSVLTRKYFHLGFLNIFVFLSPPASTDCFPLILTDSSSAQPAWKSSLDFIGILFPSSLAWNTISVNTKQSRCTEISNCSYCFFSFLTPLEKVNMFKVNDELMIICVGW